MKKPNPTSLIFKQIVFLLISIVIARGADSDFDGLDDAVETNNGIYVSPSNTGTNPGAADSDGDGVPDGREVADGTNPTNVSSLNTLSKGLVAYYPFNGNANDESGNGYHGSVLGAELTVDRFGKSSRAYYFDGANYDRISVYIPSLTDMTITFWVKTMEVVTGGGAGRILKVDREVFDIAVNNTPGNGEDIYIQNSNGWLNTNVKSDLYQWHFFAFNRDGANIYVYKDGVLVSTIPAPAVSVTIGYFGAYWANPGDDLHGVLDDIRIYNRSLTTSEVFALHSSERPRYQIIKGPFTWHEAKVDAEARGGRLAVLDTQAKIDATSVLLSSIDYPSDTWIGLTDEFNEGQWKWITGNNLSSSNWHTATGEPNNGNGGEAEHYALMAVAWQWRWNDGAGRHRLSYLFESAHNLALNSSPYGSVSGSGTYDFGNTATIIATPNLGYLFTGWTGDASGTANPLTVTMDGDKTIGANFAQDLSDPDGDGLTSYRELVELGTDPNLADTDGDGVNDDKDAFPIDPLETLDTDGDGVGNNADLDDDGDGLSDEDELLIYQTNPLRADTDGDGLSDSVEIQTHQTNPRQADTDGDGLKDGQEVNVRGTNPLVADTDGDGFLDGYEVLTGKSPLDAASKPALVAEARTAIEFTFPAAVGRVYRIEASFDLENWETVESGIQGAGVEVQRFYTTRGMQQQYFRVEEETAGE